MILSRVIEHVKKQHWTAIALDFLIVVMGVFIGMQVSNWNDARKTHDRASAYTENLRADLQAEYEITLALRRYFEGVLDSAKTAYDGFSGRREIDDKTLLIAAFRARQFNWYERRRATFDELLSSGALGLISDRALKQAAVIYYNTPLFTSMEPAATGSDAYSDIFDERLEPDVREALADNCGDRRREFRRGAAGLLEIDYPCDPALDEAAIHAAVDSLRSDDALKRALRRKIIRVKAWIRNIDILVESSGVAELFPHDAEQ